jgi:hypothetical protein
VGLGTVDPHPDPLGVGVGEQVRQGEQPDTGAVGDGEAASRQPWADLADRAGVERAERGVR